MSQWAAQQAKVSSPKKRRLIVVALGAMLIAAAVGALLYSRGPKPSEHRAVPHGHHAHAAPARGNPPSVPAAANSQEREEKARRELEESREQVERLKAQGVGRAEVDRQR